MAFIQEKPASIAEAPASKLPASRMRRCDRERNGVADGQRSLAARLQVIQQPFHARFEAAFDFGFDVRGEVVDHVLHDQLRGGAQFAVQVQ